MGKKIFFSEVLTSTFPLPTCKNLGLYEALNRSSADVEETHRTFIFRCDYSYGTVKAAYLAIFTA